MIFDQGSKIFIIPYWHVHEIMYNTNMIQGFADKETEKVYHGQFSAKLPQSIQKTALRKLYDDGQCKVFDRFKSASYKPP